jgi:hypothetical protein
MFEYDLHEAKFIAPAADRDEAGEVEWSPTMEMFAELGLLAVAESEATRRRDR